MTPPPKMAIEECNSGSDNPKQNITFLHEQDSWENQGAEHGIWNIAQDARNDGRQFSAIQKCQRNHAWYVCDECHAEEHPPISRSHFPVPLPVIHTFPAVCRAWRKQSPLKSKKPVSQRESTNLLTNPSNIINNE